MSFAEFVLRERLLLLNFGKVSISFFGFDETPFERFRLGCAVSSLEPLGVS